MAQRRHTIMTLTRLPMVPLKDVVVFPGMVTPLLVGRPASLAAVEECLASGAPVFLCTQRDSDMEMPEMEDLYPIGVIANLLQTLRMPDGTMKIVIEGRIRGQLCGLDFERGFGEAEVHEIIETETQDKQATALMRTVMDQFEDYVRLSQRVAPEIVVSIRAVTDLSALADTVSAYMPVPTEERQELLAMTNPCQRLEHISGILLRELDLLEIEQSVRERVREQMERGQREYYLHEQMKAIQRELGNREDFTDEIADLQEQISKARMPAEAKEKAEQELRRYERMPSMSPEAAVIRSYLEWLVEIPWKKKTKEVIDIGLAEKILDEDHYGLTKVKERILEFLAVRSLHKGSRGPVLCLVGPPGVGKTSLGKSIARAMTRKFVRVSLGGVRDEAEIRGHRRTYIGALPGRIIQSMRKVGVRNPLFMLDELDKMTMDFRGDPSSALLEVLDPEQNSSFSDHYLEVDYDLSDVFFIATANSEYEIPYALHDRLEIVRLSGYTANEKEHIARLFLIPKQIRENGLSDGLIRFADSGLMLMINRYTREAGVRELERKIAAICRKVARQVVTRKPAKAIVINAEQAQKFLGPETYTDNRAEDQSEIGLAVGMAWTETGGDILCIETSLMPGKGELMLTGQLGEVMQESARAAHTYLRANGQTLRIPPRFHREYDMHIHMPEGAIPKDGPSAGVAMAISMLSALRKQAPEPRVAVTGEITLRGRVLPVGGVKEKVIAAHRAGIRTVILPAENKRDLVEIPKEVLADIEFKLVKTIGEVFDVAFASTTVKKASRKKTKTKTAPKSKRQSKATPAAGRKKTD